MTRILSRTTDRRRFVAGIAATGLALAVAPRLTFAQSTPATTATLPAGAAAWPRYNLNTITDAQILSIPGAGDQMTREFAEYRPWTTIGQFRAEIGKYVGDDVVASYEPYVFVPIDPTAPDADTLAQLPGLDADEAAQLAGSPYGDDAGFLAALAGVVSAEQAALAPAYLASAAAPVATWAKFDLNQVTSDQILSIPGAGDQMTREFAEYRPWTTIGQFRAEIGKYVGDDVVAGYERYVYVPIDPTAGLDADTVAQLPGVDADEAAQLAGGGPYADADAFLAALADLVSAEQLDAAAGYLS